MEDIVSESRESRRAMSTINEQLVPEVLGDAVASVLLRKELLPEEHPASNIDMTTHHFWKNRGTLAAPVSLFFGFATGIYIPVITELYKHQVCTISLNYSQEICRTIGQSDSNISNDDEANHVRSITADYLLFSNIASSIPGIIFAMFLGPWSDRFGRKVPMMFPFSGFILASGLILMCIYLELPPAYNIIAAFVGSTFGGWTIFLMAQYSYIGDYTTERNRSVIISICMGCLQIGLSCGQLAGSQLLKHFGFPAPFLCYAAFHAAALLYIIFFIKDHHSFEKTEMKKISNMRHIFNIQGVRDNWAMLRRKRENNGRFHIVLILISYTAAIMCIENESAILQLLVEFKPLGWTVNMYTTFVSIQGIVSLVALSISIPVFKRVIKMQDMTMGIIAATSGILCSYGYAISIHSWIVYTTLGLGIFRSLSFICMQSVLIGFVERGETGKILSIVGSIQSISQVTSSLLFNSIFSATAFFWPGLVFALQAYMLLLPLISFSYLDVVTRNFI